MRSQTRVTLPMLGLLLAACAAAPAARAQAFSDLPHAQVDYSQATHVPDRTCEGLARHLPQEVVALSATSLPASGTVPAQCRLRGTLSPEILFEVSLPAHWNGRFFMFGNGALAGESLDLPMRTAQRDAALTAGFAVAQTNTGHDAARETGGTFVLENPQKAIDYAYRAVHLTTVTAKALVRRYYASPVRRAYWSSCSNGGRQGLIEVQRYPGDYDGVIATAPWVDQTGYTIGAIWNQKALARAPLSPAKLSLLGRQVMARCDAIDGVKDGLIDDPRRCDFDAHRDVPACADGTDTPDCLTSAQADTVMKIYSGPEADGQPIFPGYMPGSEAPVPGAPGAAPASAWLGALVPLELSRGSADFVLADNIMRYLVHVPPQPGYDSLSFDFSRDPPLLAAWGRLANATQTDLSAFRARGGKLLITIGWADQILQPLQGVRYYEQAAAKNGPHSDTFLRLFMVPGMTHCSGGNGTDRYDPMTAVVDWVETGKAPDRLLARHVQDGQTVRTRPLCPYPQVARYDGKGSIDEAASFHCASSD